MLDLFVLKMPAKRTVSKEIGKLVSKKFDYDDSYGMITSELGLFYWTVQSVVIFYRKTGETEKSKNCHRQPSKLTDEVKLFIKEIIDPDCTKTFRYVRQKML